MSHMRRAADYIVRRHLIEQFLTRVSGDGWMAKLADRLGVPFRLFAEPNVVICTLRT